MSKNTIDLTQNVDDIIKNMAGIIENILLQAHPVGSYYFSDDPTDPGELFGGTWEALTPGYTLVAQGTATEQHGSTTWTKEFKAGQKYGEFEHQLTVGELAYHRHVGIDIDNVFVFGWDAGSLAGANFMEQLNTGQQTANRITTGFTGSNEYHENLSPCVATYGWKRVI